MSKLNSLIQDFSITHLIAFFRESIPSFSPDAEELDHLFTEAIYDKYESVTKIGEAKIGNDDLIIITSKTNDPLTERTGKKNQYEIAKTILKQEVKDASIFVFYDDEGNFRFSFVRANYLGTKRDFTSFKRYTHFVEHYKPNRTFIEQIGKCAFSDLDNIQNAFNLKKLNNEFYQELFSWYLWAKDYAQFPNDTNEDKDKLVSESLIRFISRLLFVWFMKEKNLITNQLFDASALQNILKDFDSKADKNTYYKAILQNLFFATLNVPIEERKWIDGKKKNKAQQGDPLIYRYENEFTNSEKAIKDIFMQIPFLNGGLFDCLDDRPKNIFVDGFTKNEKKQPQLPNFLFFGEHKDIDLSHHFADDVKEKKKWKKQHIPGIIDLLNNYNFTVEENTPLEIEVALDPELLGKVFENLLATFNPETKATARKQTGSFYTPREIVNYMVDESLKQHLLTHLPEYEIEINQLFNEETTTLDDNFKQKAVEVLFDCKIVDPACGSGAYPMGVLLKMVELMTILDDENKYLKKNEGKKLDQLIAGANTLSDTNIRLQTIQALKKQKEILQNATYDYVRKLYIIENCIYGVDIQPIAIQISKLRFFISLLVEQNKNDNQANMGIEPLPNMDFKLVAANTLIAPPQEDKNIGLFAEQDDFFDAFERLAHDYFTLHTPEAKKQKKKEIEVLINQKVEEKKITIQRQIDVGKKATATQDSLKLWESYPNLFKEKAVGFFDTPYFFPKVKDGFDIVIGNPPYIQMQKDGGKLADLYKNQNFETYQRTGDIYSLFYEQGIKMLKEKGNLNYITSNKWMRAKYGESLRAFFIKYNPHILIDLGADVFENATVDTNIIIVSKETNKNNCKALDLSKEKNITNLEAFKNQWTTLTNLTHDAWAILSTTENNIKQKIKKRGKPLKDWDIQINYGIKTGYNKAFIIDIVTKEHLCAEDPKSAEIIKPILRGKDIKKYRADWAEWWLIFIPWHFPLQKDSSISGSSIIAEKAFKNQYPAIYNHLCKYKIQLSARNKAETGIRYEWYALQRCAATYYEEFEKEKIVWNRIASEKEFSLVEKGMLIQDSMHFFTGSHLNFLIGVLSSKVVKWLLYFIIGEAAGGNAGNADNIKILPIPEITSSVQQPFITLVNQILADKKAGKNTGALEHQIDVLVYHLYGLSYEEACVIDEKLIKEDFEKYQLNI